MKYINKILSLFVIALIATSCDPDAESYTPGEQEDGNQGICFVGNYTQTVEVEPGITSFDLTLTRALTDAVGTVDVTVINNEENIFICPSTVSFAAGEKTAKLTVEAPSAAEGITYNLQLALSGNDVSNYSSGYHEISVNFAILKWESIGTGYYLDGTVSNFFKVDPSVPMAVEIEKTTTATSTGASVFIFHNSRPSDAFRPYIFISAEPNTTTFLSAAGVPMIRISDLKLHSFRPSVAE